MSLNVTESAPNNVGSVLVTLTYLILLLPFLGMCCFLINVRYRFLIFDLFFKRRRPQDSLQYRNYSQLGGIYHRLSEVNSGVDEHINPKLLKLYPEIHRFGAHLPPVFRLQKNLLLVPQKELSITGIGPSREEMSYQMEQDLLNKSETVMEMKVPLVEDADQKLKTDSYELDVCLQSNEI